MANIKSIINHVNSHCKAYGAVAAGLVASGVLYFGIPRVIDSVKSLHSVDYLKGLSSSVQYEGFVDSDGDSVLGKEDIIVAVKESRNGTQTINLVYKGQKIAEIVDANPNSIYGGLNIGDDPADSYIQLADRVTGTFNRHSLERFVAHDGKEFSFEDKSRIARERMRFNRSKLEEATEIANKAVELAGKEAADSYNRDMGIKNYVKRTWDGIAARR